jgi:hypothetical protein
LFWGIQGTPVLLPTWGRGKNIPSSDHSVPAPTERSPIHDDTTPSKQIIDIIIAITQLQPQHQPRRHALDYRDASCQQNNHNQAISQYLNVHRRAILHHGDRLKQPSTSALTM